MSRAVKLVLMGVAGAALLYSCAPGGGLGALPYLWFLPNPFFRGPVVSAPASAPGPKRRRPREQGRAEPEPARRLRRDGLQGGSSGAS